MVEGKSGSVREVGRKIDYLGYQFDHRKTLLRKKNKKNFARKINKVKSRRRRKEIMSNYWGQCLHGDCRNLWNKLTDNYMGFAKKGVNMELRSKDGKLFLEGDRIAISELKNKKFTVIKFVDGLEIQEQKEGKKKRLTCIVQIEVDDEVRKIFTTSHFIRNTLQEAQKEHDKSNNVFPVDGVGIEKVKLGGGRYTYKFI